MRHILLIELLNERPNVALNISNLNWLSYIIMIYLYLNLFFF